MAAPVYSSVDRLRAVTGIQPGDIGFTTDAELTEALHELLVEVKSEIDADRNRDYHEEESVPPGINAIALDMAAIRLRNFVQTRTTPVVSINDFTVRVMSHDVLTGDIRRRLSRFPRKAVIRIGTTAKKA